MTHSIYSLGHDGDPNLFYSYSSVPLIEILNDANESAFYRDDDRLLTVCDVRIFRDLDRVLALFCFCPLSRDPRDDSIYDGLLC